MTSRTAHERPVRPAAARTHRRWTSILKSYRSPWRCWLGARAVPSGALWYGCVINAGTSRHSSATVHALLATAR